VTHAAREWKIEVAVASFLTGREFFGVRLSVIVLSLVVLALVAIAHAVLGWWMRGRARRGERTAETTPEGGRLTARWLSRALREAVPPLALMVWVHGFHVAITLLIGEVDRLETADQLRAALGWGYGAAVLLALVWLLTRAGRLIESMLVSMAARSETVWDDVLMPFAGRAARRLLPLVALVIGAPALVIPPAMAHLFRTATSLVLIAAVGFVLYQLVDALATVVLRRHRLDAADNLQARAIHTQVLVLRRVAIAVLTIFTLASMLMVFESVRQFGASILASAGIAGIIVGFAAQRSIATLLAGFQIAMTQPIRVDDVVIVENEWGRIEEITLTYVVVRIWDLRRLVLPISYFIERPFQNWTRTSAELLATVFLHVDYTAPLDAIRGELTRVLAASTAWDGKVNVLQVTDAKERTLEIRALASAADASLAWDLRCEVREKLVTFLQRHHPECLPRLRGTLEARIDGAVS
jgi:small-conductance mechanosensitive channel